MICQARRVIGLGLLILVLVETWGAAQSPSIIVAIDAGHGGDDTGGIGIDNLVEKDIVLKVAHLIALEAVDFPHIKIILTRHDDRYLSPKERVQNAQDAHLCISLHLDFSYDPWMHGITILVPTKATPAAWALAEALRHSLAVPTVSWGTKSAPLWLRRFNIPAVQVNLGFLSNPQEARRLNHLAYQRRLARAILEGIESFLRARF